MKQSTKSIKRVLAALLTIAALMTGQHAFANTWSVSYTGGKFVITRVNSGGTEIVKYRTVSISALDGKHFTGVNGSVTFAAGETTKEVAVAEKGMADVPLQYRYQGINKLYYDFQVLDQSGGLLAKCRKQISTGGEMNNPYYLNGYESYVMNDMFAYFLYLNEGKLAGYLSSGSNYYRDISYTPPTTDVETSGTLNGYVLIDDSYDYTQKSATVSPDFFFAMNRAGATGAWHKLVGNKLLASVCFTEKEKDDGYAYVQILIGDSSTAYDEGYDPNGSVNTPVNSIYKACFELKKGSGAYSGSGKWIFPHSYDVHNQAEEYSQYHQMDDQSAFYMADSYLWEQKFRSEDYRAPGFNNAFLLDPDISALTVRFDCGGSDNDTFGYKDLFVRYGLVDKQAPTVLKDDITVNPGLHCKGNEVTVSIPFSEPVEIYFRTRYILHTSWGDLVADHDCDGSNVVSFSGIITADAGTPLTINSLEATVEPGNSASDVKPIRDIVSHKFEGDISKSLNVSVDEIYKITYNLNGGTVSGDNPAYYSNTSETITLINPTRENYIFTGWTGTDLNAATMTVTIPAGSTGDRTYTANWAPDLSSIWTGDGTEASPYVISSVPGMELLAFFVNEGISFTNTYFELGANIDFSGATFSGIGGIGKDFQGKLDGKGHIVSNFTVNANGQENSGLFRSIVGADNSNHAVITNLIVSNATINGKNRAGAITGYTKYCDFTGCTAKNCTISGSSDNQNYVGGIAGTFEWGTLTGGIAEDCTISGGGAKTHAGGIAGYTDHAEVVSTIAKDCTINGTSTGTTYVGGIAGYTNYANVISSIAKDCTISGTSTANTYIGGVVGYIYVQTITGSTVDGCNITSEGTSGTRIAPIAGYINYARTLNCFVLNTVSGGTGTVYGGYVNPNYNPAFNDHYHNLTLGTDAPISDVYRITTSPDVTASGTPTVSYDGVDYYVEGATATLGYSGNVPSGSTLTFRVIAGETDITATAVDGTTLTVPASDVTIIAGFDIFYLAAHAATVLGEPKFVTTFYHSSLDFQLPKGALAYTASMVNGDVVFYRIGEDSDIIPHGTAVIVVADAASVGLTKLDSDPGVTPHAGNILLGTDTEIATPAGTVYVLGVAGEPAVLGFYKYSGVKIPARKAYYVVE